jgi:hypothetical protein
VLFHQVHWREPDGAYNTRLKPDSCTPAEPPEQGKYTNFCDSFVTFARKGNETLSAMWDANKSVQEIKRQVLPKKV